MSNNRFPAPPPVPQRQQSQAVILPFDEVAGFVFNVSAIVAIDMVGYFAAIESDTPREDRQITLYLTFSVSKEFTGTDADLFYHWFLRTTGQSRVNPV